MSELPKDCGKRQPTCRSRAAARPTQKAMNLALQGGGAHGAFAWGVLDRLLADDRVTIDGISATSAGAMNAVMVAYGLMIGGREGARRALDAFWQRIGSASPAGWPQSRWIDRMMHNDSLTFSRVFTVFDFITRLFSPYEFNPLNVNPLRDMLSASVDFEVLRTEDCPVKLFLSATNVRSGKIRVFERRELSVDHVMASACLPLIFQAVEIEGEHYWDGGYMGNPAIFPLIYNCDSRDVVVVHINPLYRGKLPRTAAEILNRINEISFNASLMREMRAIRFVTELIDDKVIVNRSLRRMLIHSISADAEMAGLGTASKLNTDIRFLVRLRDAGRRHAEAWLAANFELLGRESTINIRQQYL